MHWHSRNINNFNRKSDRQTPGTLLAGAPVLGKHSKRSPFEQKSFASQLQDINYFRLAANPESFTENSISFIVRKDKLSAHINHRTVGSSCARTAPEHVELFSCEWQHLLHPDVWRAEESLAFCSHLQPAHWPPQHHSGGHSAPPAVTQHLPSLRCPQKHSSVCSTGAAVMWHQPNSWSVDLKIVSLSCDS